MFSESIVGGILFACLQVSLTECANNGHWLKTSQVRASVTGLVTKNVHRNQ